MGESGLARAVLIFSLDSEAALKARAGEVACSWLELGTDSLLVGLRGDLGAGKTTWVRGMLEGLGYSGRVPSPTYTLLEHYALETVTVVHVDLYRLTASGAPADARELESLGLRDWLAQRHTWLFVEWPERAPALAARCDLVIDFELAGAERRTVRLQPQSEIGELALKGLAPGSEAHSS